MTDTNEEKNAPINTDRSVTGESRLQEADTPVNNETVQQALQDVMDTSGYYDQYLANEAAISAEETVRLQEAADKTKDAYDDYINYEYVPDTPPGIAQDYMQIPDNQEERNAYQQKHQQYLDQLAAEAQLKADFEAKHDQNDRNLVTGIPIQKLDDLAELAAQNYYRQDDQVNLWQQAWDDAQLPTNQLRGMGLAAAEAYGNKLGAIGKNLNEAKEERRIALETAQEIMRMLAIKEAQDEAVRREDYTYVAEMAKIQCSKGLRKSYFLMEEPHHVYIKGIPMCTTADVIPDQHIINFGGCVSRQNPALMKQAERLVDQLREKYNLNKTADYEIDDLLDLCACPCTPEFTTTWLDGQEQVTVDGAMPLLRRCEIFCRHGGKIVFRTSGQPD